MIRYKETYLHKVIMKSLAEALTRYEVSWADAAEDLGIAPPRLCQMKNPHWRVNTDTESRIYNYPHRLKMAEETIRRFRQGLDYLQGYLVEGKISTEISKELGACTSPQDIMGFYVNSIGEVVCKLVCGAVYPITPDVLPYAREWARQLFREENGEVAQIKRPKGGFKWKNVPLENS